MDFSKVDIDLYNILGLQKSCSASEVRNAYKKLAMKWHPDKCATSAVASEAKDKFQAIHEAYVVLSDENKRFSYDADTFDAEKNDNNATYGMNDFLSELTELMTKAKSPANSVDNAGELKDLFMKIRDEDTYVQASNQKASSSDFGVHFSHKRSVQDEQFCFSAKLTSSKAAKLFERGQASTTDGSLRHL